MTPQTEIKLIERLKGDEGPKGTIIRALSGMMLWLRYDDESGGIIATNQEGAVLMPAEFQEILEGLNLFFDHYSEESIEQFNAELKQRRAQIRTEVDKPKRKPVVGYVYLIRAENGLHKIGKAKNITARMKPFSVEFPMKWDLVHFFASDDYSAAEETLHRLFHDKRGVGEWFQLLPEDVAYITSIKDGQL
jgi:hypothetical protein